MSIILKAKDQKAVKNATENIGHLVERITEQRHTASTMGLGIIAGGSFYGATDYFGEGRYLEAAASFGLGISICALTYLVRRPREISRGAKVRAAREQIYKKLDEINAVVHGDNDTSFTDHIYH